MRRNVRLFTWFNFFRDFIPYAPVAILYFSQVAGSYALGMTVFAVNMVAVSILEVPTGILSDLVGRRQTMILGSLCAVLSSIAYALGLVFGYPALIGGAVLDGAARAFFSGNDEALLHNTLEDDGSEGSYHEYLGKLSAMFQVALAISSVLGSILAAWSFALVMWISVLPQLGCFVLSFFFIEPRSHQKDETSNVFAHLDEALKLFRTNTRLRALSLASMLNFALSESSYQFRSAFVNTVWPLWAVGLSKTLSNIGAAVSFYFSGRLINRFSALRLLVWKGLITKIVTLTALLFPSVASPALLSSTSFLYGFGEVAETTLLQKEFSSKQRATMSSLNSLGGSLLFGACAFLLGLLADSFGPRNALLLTSVAGFSVLWLHWNLFKKDDSIRV